MKLNCKPSPAIRSACLSNRAPPSPFLQKPKVFGNSGALIEKCDSQTRRKNFLGSRISRQADACEMPRNSGETRTVFPSLLVATRRRRADGAQGLPSCPRALVSPFPQKSHGALLVAIFGVPHYFKGTHSLNAATSPFP